MEKANKKRLVAWSIILGLCLLLAGGGLALHFMGYGNSGKVREKVLPYITRFNSLNEVRALGYSAVLTDTGIDVMFTEQGVQKKVSFKYVREANVYDTLQTTYNSRETQTETVVKNMIEAISVQNGNREGAVFETIDYNDLYETTLSQGVNLNYTGSTIIVKLNLNANILTNINGGGVEENTYNIYFEAQGTIDSYINYIIPAGFEKRNELYSTTTSSNTCTLRTEVVSNYVDSSSLATDIITNEAASEESMTVNGISMKKLTYASSLGGKTKVYVSEINGKVIYIEAESYYDNNECEKTEQEFINSIQSK